MPIYEFKCLKCRKKFEKIISFSSRAKSECPKCKSKKVQKLISSFGINKGSYSEASFSSKGGCGGGCTSGG
ncbi:MAG: zinc ribbon domain-containing protein [Planctomycetes bacterium]|nr:zinc ribbon domain-containing protein [Planctomycetota bacterium]